MELTFLWGCFFGVIWAKKVAEIRGIPDDFTAIVKHLK